MFQINNILINNATEKDKQIISNSTIKKIDKEILPKVASPSSNVENIDNFENNLNTQLSTLKNKIIQSENSNGMNKLVPMVIKNRNELLNYQKLSKNGSNNDDGTTTKSFINDKLKVDKNSNLYGVGRNVKDVYCIFGKYQLKKSIIKVTKQQDPSIPLSSLELLAIYTKAYQFMYKDQEKWFINQNKKKRRIITPGYQNSPHGIYKYGINDISYNGLSTIIEFDSFIVISFDVDPKNKK